MRAALEGWRPRPGRRPPIAGLREIGTIARRSATADLRWLASRAPQGDGNESVADAIDPRSLAIKAPRRHDLGRAAVAEIGPVRIAGEEIALAVRAVHVLEQV